MTAIQIVTNYPITAGVNTGNFIVVDTPNVNIRAILLANGWNGISIINVIFTIATSATVFSASTGVPALDTGVALPVGSSLQIINNGTIVGKGGAGGYPNGGAGGIALKAQWPITVTNNGLIGGGGGGGGSGGVGTNSSIAAVIEQDGGGGAGGGAGIGAGAASNISGLAAPINYGAAGKAGDYINGGAGGRSGGSLAGSGGSGGSLGNAGQSGGSGYAVAAGASIPGGVGGAAGAAVSGDANITWSLLGTILGARI